MGLRHFLKGEEGLTGWSVGWAVFIGTMVTGGDRHADKRFCRGCHDELSHGRFWLSFYRYCAHIKPFYQKRVWQVSPFDGLLVGLAQGIAVMPEVSRSGMTMMAGTAAGISREEVFRFSFLLSIPAIAGAALFQAREVGGLDSFVTSLPDGWYLGAAAAFVSGLVSLFVLRKLVIASKWWVFGIYCLALGSLSVITSFLGVW